MRSGHLVNMVPCHLQISECASLSVEEVSESCVTKVDPYFWRESSKDPGHSGALGSSFPKKRVCESEAQQILSL